MTNDPVRVAADEFWKAYLEVLPESERGREYFEAFQFGAGREMANQLARLVLDGIKTATSDLIWHLEFQHKPLARRRRARRPQRQLAARLHNPYHGAGGEALPRRGRGVRVRLR